MSTCAANMALSVHMCVPARTHHPPTVLIGATSVGTALSISATERCTDFQVPPNHGHLALLPRDSTHQLVYPGAVAIAPLNSCKNTKIHVKNDTFAPWRAFDVDGWLFVQARRALLPVWSVEFLQTVNDLLCAVQDAFVAFHRRLRVVSTAILL